MPGSKKLLIFTVILGIVLMAAPISSTEHGEEGGKCSASKDADSSGVSDSGSCGCKTSRKDAQPKPADVTDEDDVTIETETESVEQDQGDTPNDDSFASDSKRYPRTNQMLYIPGGTFSMGTDEPVFAADGEMPSRKVTVDSFYMDEYEVSNAEFKRFVDEKKYKTEVSEKNLWTIMCSYLKY